MRYLSIWHPSKATIARGPTPEMMGKMNAFIEELTKKGILLATGGRAPNGDCFSMRNEQGEIRIVDGPFPEAKEVVGGFALMEFPSREVAVETCKRFLTIAGEGESTMFLVG